MNTNAPQDIKDAIQAGPPSSKLPVKRDHPGVVIDEEPGSDEDRNNYYLNQGLTTQKVQKLQIDGEKAIKYNKYMNALNTDMPPP